MKPDKTPIEGTRPVAPPRNDLKPAQKYKYVTKKEAVDFLNKYDTFLFDMDGVIWRGSHTIDGSIDTIRMLQKMKKQVYFVTNNSTKSRGQYVKKFKGLHLDVDKHHCYGSASIVALFLQHCKDFNCKTDKVYVIGQSGIMSELKQLGIEYLYEHMPYSPDDINELTVKLDPAVKVLSTHIGGSHWF